MSPPTHPVDVCMILSKGNDVLLSQRQNTGYADGMWNPPSGKLEYYEDAITGVIREAREEIGLSIPAEDVRLAAVVHHKNPLGAGRIGLFFHVEYDSTRHGEIINAEPHKCAALEWFPSDALPEETYPYTIAGITAYRKGTPLLLDGWDQDAPAKDKLLDRMNNAQKLSSGGTGKKLRIMKML